MRDRTKELGNVQEIHEGLQSLKKMVSNLENKQRTVLGVALPEESKLVVRSRSEFSSRPGSAKHARQHGVLSREFVELMGHCNTIQAEYRDRNVERIQRQLKITGNNVTEEELDAMLESGQTDVFTQNILIDAQATRQALNEIESRHDEILKLERSIRDLHDMFQYLAMEVEAQGEMVNRIETNIKDSVNYVEKAKENTEKAVTYQQKARKKKLWIAICCAILLLILIISLVTTFGT
ncbi:hypothetical protein FQN60_002820 [Etheostoma spectabile]|uniref:t-SNARE coiled-coil homology domain-containing protein n=1 Tax=Etheostoma spectabile TaxID=54343 RepID=A0A5J5CKN7_9PERO|nr:hypothetical protein FQN60_002820 [Etheostoma spectabile]